MTRKEQALIRSRGSLAFSLLYAVLSLVEEVMEERGLGLEDFSSPWSLRDSLLSDPLSLLERGVVEVYSSRVSDPVSREVEVWGRRVRVSVSPGFGDEGVRSLYLAAPRLVSLDSGLVREKARRTTMDGTEYMFIYLDSGELAVFEGETYRVRLPFVRAVATVHTHPEGSCGLSMPDVQSGLDLLSEGGLLSGAATESCLAYMSRVGLVVLDDYVAVKEALYYKRVHDLWKRRFESLLFGVVAY